MIRSRWSALLLAALLACPAVASAQLVNGSFEPTTPFSGNNILPGGSTAIPGWVTTDSGVEWFTPATYGVGAAAHGIAVVDLANYTFSAGGIQQTIPTTAGEVVRIDFFYGTSLSAGRDGTATIVVSADGQTQNFSITNTSAIVAWQPRTFTFTADGPSATLSFRCLQNANTHFAFIDGVGRSQVVPTEASTWGRIKRLYSR